MTKILVVSDNHGDLSIIDKIIKKEKPDYSIHCGDYLVDKKEIEKRFDFFVPGNNDFDFENLEIVVKIDGINFWIMHGHTLGMDLFNKEKIINELSSKGISALIHGHLHIPILFQKDGYTIFCPGSTNFPRDNNGATYGIITVNKNTINFKHIRVN